jgi:hypothetical protein
MAFSEPQWLSPRKNRGRFPSFGFFFNQFGHSTQALWVLDLNAKCVPKSYEEGP